MADIRIVITSQYGTLSRGRHSGRKVDEWGKLIEWAKKNADGQIVIDSPGRWHLYCHDGFRREARAVLIVDNHGDWEMTGDTKRFDVIEE